MERKNELVIILKNAGTTCNIGCTYCAEARKVFVAPDKSKIVTMDDIRMLISATDSIKYLTVLFHGGEPMLLPVSYYDEIIETWRKARDDVFFGVQTNATLIDEEWLDFISRHREQMGISISLDGDEYANGYRIGKDGKQTYEIVLTSLKKLEQRGLRTGIISTLTKATLGREQQLADLISSFTNIRFLKMNPCFDIWCDGTIPEWGITPGEYSNFVIRFFDIMLNKRMFDKVDVEPILSIIKNLEGIGSSYCNYSPKKCNYFVSVYPGGILISCDNFSISEGKLGNLYNISTIQEVLDFHKNQELLEELNSLLISCPDCTYYGVCTGGCLAVRRRYVLHSGQHGDKCYCQAMKQIIDYIRYAITSVRGFQ